MDLTWLLVTVWPKYNLQYLELHYDQSIRVARNPTNMYPTTLDIKALDEINNIQNILVKKCLLPCGIFWLDLLVAPQERSVGFIAQVP